MDATFKKNNNNCFREKKQGNYGYDNRGSDTKLYYMLSEHGNVSS
jgi:hypothetical protein